MHMANCEYLLISISCEMNADQSFFVMDLNERRSYRKILVWSITLHFLQMKKNSPEDEERKPDQADLKNVGLLYFYLSD